MTCPRCGKDTPKDSFCSIECMKLYNGKQINEEEELKRRYEMLNELTNDFNNCPFCNVKLRLSKPKSSDKDEHLLERNKYCPRCYRVFGYMISSGEDDIWTFMKIPFEDAKKILKEMKDILNPELVE
ncbi:MAG: hypothetical protein ACTSQO_01095 [Candidatus Helarchaeota archaeon]